jgi:hypothetical protein
MQITVSKKNLDTALVAVRKPSAWFTEVCLVAQSLRTAFPRKRVKVGYEDATVGNKYYSLPKEATRLIQRFDKLAGGIDEFTKAEKARLAKLRETLPITFSIEAK